MSEDVMRCLFCGSLNISLLQPPVDLVTGHVYTDVDDYRCVDCGKQFSVYEDMMQANWDEIKCPSCGSADWWCFDDGTVDVLDKAWG